jgi:hypothetical protein
MKIKLPPESYRGAIRAEWLRGELTIKQIAERYGVAVRTVQKWKERDSVVRKKRVCKKKKINHQMKIFLKAHCASKFTGVDGASSRKMAAKLRARFRIRVSHSTVNKTLNSILSKPINAGSTFILTPENKMERVEFIKWIKENNIRGRDILFTDEKIFRLHVQLNPQLNKMRLTKTDKEKYRKGDPKMVEKIKKPLPKFSPGVMVAAGVSYYGVTKLIFCVGTMDKTSYVRTLNYWRDDLERLDPDLNLYFQQDNARPHSSGMSADFISNNFPKVLRKWPVNSPDISPIEDLWAIVQEKLYEKNYRNLDELKLALVKVWNSIPVSLCRKLVDSFEKKIEQIKETGEKYNRKIEKILDSSLKPSHRWNHPWNNSKEIENVVFNDKSLSHAKEQAVKHHRRLITHVTRDYRKNIAPKYKPRALQRGAPNSVKQDLKKMGQEAKEQFDLKKQKFLNRIDQINEMTIEEFYQFLNPQRKFKLIKMGKKLCAYKKDETAFSDSEEVPQNNINNVEENPSENDAESEV